MFFLNIWKGREGEKKRREKREWRERRQREWRERRDRRQREWREEEEGRENGEKREKKGEREKLSEWENNSSSRATATTTDNYWPGERRVWIHPSFHPSLSPLSFFLSEFLLSRFLPLNAKRSMKKILPPFDFSHHSLFSSKFSFFPLLFLLSFSPFFFFLLSWEENFHLVSIILFPSSFFWMFFEPWILNFSHNIHCFVFLKKLSKKFQVYSVLWYNALLLLIQWCEVCVWWSKKSDRQLFFHTWKNYWKRKKQERERRVRGRRERERERENHIHSLSSHYYLCYIQSDEDANSTCIPYFILLSFSFSLSLFSPEVRIYLSTLLTCSLINRSNPSNIFTPYLSLLFWFSLSLSLSMHF